MIKTTRLKRPQVPEPGELIDFDDIVGRPKYGGEEMTSETDIPTYEKIMEDVQAIVDDEATARTEADADLQSQIDDLDADIALEAATREAADEALAQDLATAISTEAGARADADNILNGNIHSEASTRGQADNILQEQIDALVASSDVKDIVGTKADLDNYDTSTLGDNDIIKVLADESQGNATTYYRWMESSSTFSLIGSEGPYYTVSQTDTLLDAKADKSTTYTKTEMDTALNLKADKANSYTKSEVDTALAGKQDVLAAGANIQINGNSISATDTTYTAGTNVQINGTTISATDTTYSDFTGATESAAGANGLVPAPASGETAKFLKSDGTWGTPEGKTYTAGANIQINDTVISATDTTYSTMTGAGASTAGTGGLVPAPVAGDNTKYLSGDGTWKTVSQYNLPIASSSTLGGVKVGNNLSIDASTGVLSADAQPAILYPTTGQNTDGALTQKAASDALDTKADASSLATVATSGSYNDLTDKPTIPAAQVNSDWNATSGKAQILNKPSLATVATSGSYNDLSNKPTIPTSGDISAAVAVETSAREAADTNLQGQIDALVASSDVKDIVGTKADLNNYDTSTLGDNDIIKVLSDESQSNATTYYRWAAASSTFTLIGTEGPYYTKSESDTLLNSKQNTISDLSTIRSGASAGATAVQPGDLATVATSGSYNDLSDKPTIPAAQIQSDWNQTTTTAKDYIKNKPANLVSDASYVNTDNNFTTALKNKLNGIATGAEVNVQANWNETSTTSDAYIQNKPSLATVATTGAYSDLTGAPSLATVATTGAYTDLSGKPSLATVATSGSYNDLSNKPTIPTVNNATLTIQNDGASAGTFTANASANKTINIVPPVKIGSTLSTPSDVAYVGTNNIADSAVTTNKVAAGAITAAKTDFGGNYSTSEVDTGFTWIDGKHVYKKTIDFGTLPNSNSKAVSHGISNLGYVIKTESMMRDSGNTGWWTIPYVTVDIVSVDRTNINIHSTGDLTAYSAYVTLYYTKSS